MKKEISIACVIVIYNKAVRDSITFKNLQQLSDPNIDILVVDNSDTANENESYCNKRGIHYLSMDGNKGLSKAYNRAVDASRNCGIIVLLDDDTEITNEYFCVLKKAVNTYPNVDIFAPIIYGQDGVIYSPNESNFLKNHFISSPEQNVPQDKFNAIASCLAIRERVFDHYRFNEKLFVDQVDQNFFDEQRKLNTEFMKIDVKILQNFYQRGAILTPEAGWRRLRLRIIDIMQHARLLGGLKYIFLGYVKCCGLGVQIGKKSRSIKVIVRAFVLSTKLLLSAK